MVLSRFCLLALILLVPITSSAQLRYYVAKIDESSWHVKQKPKIECQLNHSIPSYGEAKFISHAGKRLNINFILNMWIKPDLDVKARLVSKEPSWRPGDKGRQLSQIDFHRYFAGEVPKNIAWNMLRELEMGREPTFFYQDWHDNQQQVAVGLSSVSFLANYIAFKSCISELLPYSFDDIAFTVLSYQFGGTELTRHSEEQLAKVKTYLQYDNQADLILIDAYTDSYGDEKVNEKVSINRAETIKQFFIEQGIPASRIAASGYGERRHVAANNTAGQRGKNRRVIIQVHP